MVKNNSAEYGSKNPIQRRKTWNPIKLYKEFDAWWQRIALTCVFSLIATILLEVLNFLGHTFAIAPIAFSEAFMNLVRWADIAAIIILFIDLLFQINQADNKICYIKENWLLVLSFVPFGSSLRVLRFLKVIKTRGGVFLKGIKVAGHTSHIVKVLRPVTQIFSRSKKPKYNLNDAEEK